MNEPLTLVPSGRVTFIVTVNELLIVPDVFVIEPDISALPPRPMLDRSKVPFGVIDQLLASV